MYERFDVNFFEKSEKIFVPILTTADDGYSGKTFNRPGFNNMINDAKTGSIDCIIVKDLSRFGRDYITVDNYITRVFPFLGIRFIAVNDHFDSKRKGDIDSLDTSFRTLIYDMYSRDVSAKVISAKRNLAERGVYINSIAPYGYRRDPENKHRLLPDPNTAETVKRIFTMIADGIPIIEVVRQLNSENVSTPSAAKAGTPSSHANWPDDCFWRPAAIYDILRNREYIGSTVFGRHRRTQIGANQRTRTSPDQWIIVDDRHEPLVSKELYFRVQQQIGEYRQDAKHTPRNLPLRRKVYCGVCDRAIVRRGKKNFYYRCVTPDYVPDAKCGQDKVFESDILEIVRTAIHTQVKCAVEIQRIMDMQHKKEVLHVSAIKAELGRLINLQEQITTQNQKLYENYVDGKLTREAYAAQKAALIQKREEAYQQEAELKDRLASGEKQSCQAVKTYCNYADLDALTDHAAIELLERVTIYPDSTIDIKLAYDDELAALYEKYCTKPA